MMQRHGRAAAYREEGARDSGGTSHRDRHPLRTRGISLSIVVRVGEAVAGDAAPGLASSAFPDSRLGQGGAMVAPSHEIISAKVC